MKLTVLEPRWIHPKLFIFRCPHCSRVWLTCKTETMTRAETLNILEAGLGDGWNEIVVPPKPDGVWTPSGDFSVMSVTPSIDASASGHWHGSITNGICI